jgi:hypothetical protein
MVFRPAVDHVGLCTSLRLMQKYHHNNDLKRAIIMLASMLML